MSAEAEPTSLLLDESCGKELLRIARVTLKDFLRSGRLPPGAPHKKALLQTLAATVVLHLPEVVRSASSSLPIEHPLYLEIEHLATQAASKHSATSGAPLTLEEVADVRIELVLPREHRKLGAAPEGLALGRHGVMVRSGTQSGLLFSRDCEAGWDETRFLDEACRRAGLGDKGWHKPDVEVMVFEELSYRE